MEGLDLHICITKGWAFLDWEVLDSVSCDMGALVTGERAGATWQVDRRSLVPEAEVYDRTD